jgi:hypothetical protein
MVKCWWTNAFVLKLLNFTTVWVSVAHNAVLLLTVSLCVWIPYLGPKYEVYESTDAVF